jgi:hypothetical protein
VRGMMPLGGARCGGELWPRVSLSAGEPPSIAPPCNPFGYSDLPQRHVCCPIPPQVVGGSVVPGARENPCGSGYLAPGRSPFPTRRHRERPQDSPRVPLACLAGISARVKKSVPEQVLDSVHCFAHRQDRVIRLRPLQFHPPLGAGGCRMSPAESLSGHRAFETGSRHAGGRGEWCHALSLVLPHRIWRREE